MMDRKTQDWLVCIGVVLFTLFLIGAFVMMIQAAALPPYSYYICKTNGAVFTHSATGMVQDGEFEHLMWNNIPIRTYRSGACRGANL